MRGAIDLGASLAVGEEVHLLVPSLDICQCPSPTVQPLRQVSLWYPCLCSASGFSRGVPGFKILIKSYLTYLKPEIEDSPGVSLRKTAFFVHTYKMMLKMTR